MKTVLRRVRKKKPQKPCSITFDELAEAVGIEDSNDLDKVLFMDGTTFSVRPLIIYSEPLDDVTFYALNYPQVKFAYFSY